MGRIWPAGHSLHTPDLNKSKRRIAALYFRYWSLIAFNIFTCQLSARGYIGYDAYFFMIDAKKVPNKEKIVLSLEARNRCIGVARGGPGGPGPPQPKYH